VIIVSIATKYKKGSGGKSNVHKKERAKKEMCKKRRENIHLTRTQNGELSTEGVYGMYLHSGEYKYLSD
jgi:hypothetical protein